MAYGPTRLALCPSRWLSLVCRILVLLLDLSETNTIGYYGVQATKTFAKIKVVIHAALAKVEGVVKGAVQIIARLTYRQRYAQSTGRDPLKCPHRQREMAVWCIWHPVYGVIYDEGEVIKRGTYALTAQRAGP